MYATVQKWGNSQGIRLPKALLDAVGIRENDQVELAQVADGLQIKKVVKRHRTLEERLVGFYKKPIDQIECLETQEVDWGKPEGDEAW